ncbi:NUMOD4 motif-containing HNH endonuclease [Lactococcus formosensis]|uniref:NUMOD4 motif-containing HNH endonuclease n=1 Tax=Lactococcus formosensis TaxID=1281486 RepID=A0A9X4SJH4_9LACT|nr:NUMOD4 motif-containing HNH endonuclease [Lactococcus formosensis]MDG6143071.1 NUMOD4 motif-containing HNH endonuclease [Lactococcus formosensis]MDG6160363.1 NUMOD4 motif-containing HNH endonuclease [Lactococcus formosensis]MDG6193534.1 NUMOD4 motif-containing HNH endonuclease [Lactococcus formosensis]
MEKWKKIKGYQNYEVSDFGNIRNSRGLVMKQRTTYRGYKEIGLRNGKVQKFHLVHRLVAQAFLEEIPSKNYVNHIDGNKTNNSVENLEWVTQSENKKHAVRTGLQPITEEVIKTLKDNAIKKRKSIRVVNTKLGIDKTFPSIAEASKHIDCNEKTLRNVLKGRNKSRLGYEVTYL